MRTEKNTNVYGNTNKIKKRENMGVSVHKKNKKQRSMFIYKHNISITGIYKKNKQRILYIERQCI